MSQELKWNHQQPLLYYYPCEYQQLSIPQKVIHIDANRLFLSSQGGNSYVIKITENEIEIVQSFVNRGPILDMKPIHDPITNKDDLLLCCNTYHQ